MLVFIQFVIDGLAIGSAYALAAVGFALIYSATKTFHFAHGGAFIVAAYSYYALVVTIGASIPIALVIVICLTAIYGCAAELLIYRPMRRSDVSFLTLFAASFGLLIVTANTIALIFGSGFYTIDSTISRGVLIGAILISWADIIAILSSISLIGGLVFVLYRSRLGVGLRAMMDSQALVELYGLSSTRYSLISFAIGSILMVPVAVINLYTTGVYPSVAATITLIAIAGAIVGGVGRVVGAALGGLLLGVVENVGVWQLSSTWKVAISFGVLLLFIVIRPSGILRQRASRKI